MAATVDGVSHLLQNLRAGGGLCHDLETLFTEGEYEPKGFIALVDGRPVGLVHYMYQRTCWTVANNCYLQDLFADPEIRGKGIGRALIEAVRQAAAKDGITNVYWLTHETNATARRLYDRVAKFMGFIKYTLQ
jgi:GNAT superfamily N-acetyltransferase